MGQWGLWVRDHFLNIPASLLMQNSTTRKNLQIFFILVYSLMASTHTVIDTIDTEKSFAKQWSWTLSFCEFTSKTVTLRYTCGYRISLRIWAISKKKMRNPTKYNCSRDSSGRLRNIETAPLSEDLTKLKHHFIINSYLHDFVIALKHERCVAPLSLNPLLNMINIKDFHCWKYVANEGNLLCYIFVTIFKCKINIYDFT